MNRLFLYFHALQIYTMKKLLFFFAAFLQLALSAQNDPLWLRYCAISPDGSTIAFTYQGDIYTVAKNGGKAMALTVHEAYDFMPVWSPDGKSIAFASDRYGNADVFIMPAAGGLAERLTFHSSGDMPSDFTIDGQNVIFTSSRLDNANNQQFPSGALPELYSVPVKGGTEKQQLTTPALWARYNSTGNMMVYQDQKGYEDDYRKHHTSSVTRDIWLYDVTQKKHTQLSPFNGEDLNPVFSPDDKSIFYLSEQNGTINIVKMDIASKAIKQITTLADHPVRHLSLSDNNTLCYSYNGEIYTMTEGSAPVKVKIQIAADGRYSEEKILPVNNASEVDVSSNGKEIAFIHRGEVFVASVAEGTTKRITNTPEQERNVSFSPDGRSLVYASERNGSWNVYTSSIERKDEEYFFLSTLVKEEGILTGVEETFQPTFSPDGKEIAFLEERTALKVINLATKAIREILPADKNYSYSDGDQHYEWSPDGKWFIMSYLPGEQWIEQMGLISSDGKGKINNLSESGYGAFGSRWMMDGKMLTWFSARDGQKNHGSWGGEIDMYGMYLTQQAWDESKMNEEEYTLYADAKKKKEEEEKTKKEDEEKKKGKEDKNKDDKDKKKEELKPVKIELDGIEDRKRRLTIHSSDLSDAYVTKDGSKLFYLSSFEKGYDLWQTNLRTRETKIIAKLGANGGGMIADKEDKNLFVIAGGTITKIDIEKGEPKPIAIKGEMVLNEKAERAYLFEHIWRQVMKKFYVQDLHKTRWDFYKTEYAKQLPHINNNFDFADAMGEMLGELNASHTGAFFNADQSMGDQTARLGLFYDETFTGNGLRISEVMHKSPVLKEGTKIKAGVIIEKIDGNVITPQVSHFKFLNRKAGQNTLLSLYDPAKNTRWEEIVKPIQGWQDNELRYKRWVDNCRHIVDSLSGGKVGYVHVRGMNDQSFRVVYEEALGKNAFKEALVVDTRFNGGGWLHDDLATFLSGKNYVSFFPRGQKLGADPQFKWTKPSCVVMNESNYSDAHMFPYAYKALDIGKLVGMPVAGTGTAVWWEGLQNGVVFGIPQVGMIDTEGDYLENKQLEPDYKVSNEPEIVSKGRDQQLEKAVQVLLNK
jgi:tricorn protease